ncbi:MAG: proteasome assembly chaperone family protein [Microthrixaceae bacterium]
MSEIYERVVVPDLDQPVMVIGLEGWIDAGIGSANAMSAILTGADAETVAAFDADRLLDHRARRPIMHLHEGLITGLTWPATELRAGLDESGNDLLLLVGAEPDFEWQSFGDSVVELALELDCRMAVVLGAYPAPVPHTRDTRLALTTSSTDLSDHMRGYVRGTLDVPAGIHAVLDLALNGSGIPTVGLWAQVPHYVASMPYPGASVALLDGLARVAGIDPSYGDLVAEAAATRDRLDALVAENPQHQTMVHQLEEIADSDEDTDLDTLLDGGELPTGDELAAELQEFLRHQDDDT